MKEMKHEKKTCGAAYEVEYVDGIPVLVCSGCGHKIEDWIRWKHEWSLYWQDRAKWENKRDHPVCLLGLFLELYRAHYGVEFALSLNEGGLFKSVEMVQIRKLYHSCGANADFAANYIRWVFANKVGKGRRKITSLGFLNLPTSINEFRHIAAKAQTITRSTRLPPKMADWFRQHLPDMELNDFGDLRVLLQHIRRGAVPRSETISLMIDKLAAIGAIDENLEIVRWSE